MYLPADVSEAAVDRWVLSACLLCINGCSCEIAVKDDRMVGVRGVATDVVNHGRMGPKGLYGSTPFASSQDRLTRPLMRAAGKLVEADWDTAMGQTSWTVVYQAAQGFRDRDLVGIAQQGDTDTSRQLTWINTRMKAAAPQALLMTP